MTSAVSRSLLPALAVIVTALTLVGCSGAPTATGPAAGTTASPSASPSSTPTPTVSAEDAAFTAEVTSKLPEADMETLIPMVHQLCEDLYDDDKGYILGYGVFNDKIRKQYGEDAVDIIVTSAVETYCPGDEPKLVEAFKQYTAKEFPDVDITKALAISRELCADLETLPMKDAIDNFIVTAGTFLDSESASGMVGMGPVTFCPERVDDVLAYIKTIQ